MAKNLVGVAIYESNNNLRKITGRKIVKRSSGGSQITDTFNNPVDITIVDWLKKNTLVQMVEAMPEHFHSDHSYIFQGSNNTLCAIYPNIINLKGGEVELIPKDNNYKWRVTIRYQPATNELPVELTDALSELGLKKR